MHDATDTPAFRPIRSIQPRPCGSSKPADRARARFQREVGKPPFVADWTDALFLHFAVPAEVLQPYTPYELDLRDGAAFVSLVAIRMENFHCPALKMLGDLPWKPFANQRFLNVRTYVRHGGEPGIQFLAEFLSSRLCVALGPLTYGLPYRHADFQYERTGGEFRVEVRKGDATFRCTGCAGCDYAECKRDSLDEWLLERHTAFTIRLGQKCCFRIWHEPWPQNAAQITELDLTLLAETMPWWKHARFIGANCTPGVRGVWMSLPEIPDEAGNGEND